MLHFQFQHVLPLPFLPPAAHLAKEHNAQNSFKDKEQVSEGLLS